ncbi:hypothetical protein AB0L70_15475 [Kribbella sp. NPDC051952]|uniref:hypothetical protein n=1 Tax=Kribbella sp. NPDC051952 TaxID=3154851 RepID=UPI00342E8E48
MGAGEGVGDEGGDGVGPAADVVTEDATAAGRTPCPQPAKTPTSTTTTAIPTVFVVRTVN